MPRAARTYPGWANSNCGGSTPLVIERRGPSDRSVPRRAAGSAAPDPIPGCPSPTPRPAAAGRRDATDPAARLVAVGHRVAALVDLPVGDAVVVDQATDHRPQLGQSAPAWQELADACATAARRTGPVADGGAQPRRQRRHHLHPGRPPRRSGDQRRRRRAAGSWHLDALPLLLSASDWDTLESGLVQRSRLLDAVLTDLYGPRHAVDQRGAATPAVVRTPGVRAGPPAASTCRAGISCSCTAATSAARPTALPGQRRLDPGAVGCGLRAGRPASGRARHPRPLRADRPAARLAVGAGAAAGAHRRGPRVGRGAGGRGAQPRHSLRDRVRPGLSGQRARLPAGGERRPGGARRQAVDAVDGHAQACRRGAAPGRRRVRRSA